MYIFFYKYAFAIPRLFIIKNRYWLTNIIIHHFCFFSRQYIAFCASNNLFRASGRPACSRSIYLPRLAQTGRVVRLKRKYIPPVPWLSFCWFQTVHVWLLIERNQEASIELMNISLRCAKLKQWLGKFVCVDSIHLKITEKKDDVSSFLCGTSSWIYLDTSKISLFSNILILILAAIETIFQ